MIEVTDENSKTVLTVPSIIFCVMLKLDIDISLNCRNFQLEKKLCF